MGNFFLVPVNYPAVLVCGVINTVLGFLWYGPVYGKKRGRLLVMFVASLVTAYVLFHFIWYAAPGAYTLFIAIKTGVWGWIGLVFPMSLMIFMFSQEKKSMKLLVKETGFHLVSLMVMASIFYFTK